MTLQSVCIGVTASSVIVSSSVTIFPAIVYCDGAIVTGPSPSERRFEEKRLEKIYRCVIKKCDPCNKDPTCECASLPTRENARETALITRDLAPIITRTKNRDLRCQIDNFLNKINDRWVFFIGSADNVLVFKNKATDDERKCVTENAREQVIRLERELAKRFAECPCACDKKGNCERQELCVEESSDGASSRPKEKCDVDKKKNKNRRDKKKKKRSSESSSSSSCSSLFDFF